MTEPVSGSAEMRSIGTSVEKGEHRTQMWLRDGISNERRGEEAEREFSEKEARTRLVTKDVRVLDE